MDQSKLFRAFEKNKTERDRTAQYQKSVKSDNKQKAIKSAENEPVIADLVPADTLMERTALLKENAQPSPNDESRYEKK
ncbi:hypothetical protein BGP77_08230 [Saccharospirillum sp. MSK14-1]|uniref:hypothetical protein n=1 Tax=Saccharospirillum sp. MSK14-1 TaxID=1897632 RepID=UPI000D344420|nr:hypothetical protein [Saccharospirillum sp. MSK14-1]PTY35755.1 hypothetical protein BGP77_08230 [Saccharospirillum sp. MSK14-1]